VLLYGGRYPTFLHYLLTDTAGIVIFNDVNDCTFLRKNGVLSTIAVVLVRTLHCALADDPFLCCIMMHIWEANSAQVMPVREAVLQ